MKFGNLGSYKVLNTYVFFAYLFAIFKILSDPHTILISSCFVLDFVLNAFSKVDIHFVLFKFVVVLL